MPTDARPFSVDQLGQLTTRFSFFRSDRAPARNHARPAGHRSNKCRLLLWVLRCIPLLLFPPTPEIWLLQLVARGQKIAEKPTLRCTFRIHRASALFDCFRRASEQNAGSCVRISRVLASMNTSPMGKASRASSGRACRESPSRLARPSHLRDAWPRRRKSTLPETVVRSLRCALPLPAERCRRTRAQIAAHKHCEREQSLPDV